MKKNYLILFFLLSLTAVPTIEADIFKKAKKGFKKAGKKIKEGAKKVKKGVKKLSKKAERAVAAATRAAATKAKEIARDATIAAEQGAKQAQGKVFQQVTQLINRAQSNIYRADQLLKKLK